MATDDKKTKTSPTPKPEAKKEAPAAKKDGGQPKDQPKDQPKEKAAAGVEAAKAESAKAESAEKVDAPPSGYSRGEGQKAVTQAYKDNWNAIYGKKSNKKAKKKIKR